MANTVYSTAIGEIEYVDICRLLFVDYYIIVNKYIFVVFKRANAAIAMRLLMVPSR